jgi:hypothetical protein
VIDYRSASPPLSVKKRRRALSLVLATIGLGSCALPAEGPFLPDDGPSLAAQLRATPPPEDLEVTGLIRIRREDGRRTSQPFRYRIITGPARWQQIFEARPTGSQPAQTLTIEHTSGGSPTYTVQGPNTNDITYTGDRAMVPFAGSDFWLADLGLEFLHWPEQRIDRETRLPMRKGRSCRVLESINPAPGAGGYTRVRSWIDLKTGGILIAEAYGNDRRCLKEFEIGGFAKINDRWVLKNMEIRNLQADTRTVLEFHYELRE